MTARVHRQGKGYEKYLPPSFPHFSLAVGEPDVSIVCGGGTPLLTKEDHMQRPFIIGMALVLMLAATVASVEARTKPFHASFVGTATNKDDFSFTGTPALYLPVAGKSTLGPYTAQLVSESPPDGQTCPLPGGGSGVELVFVGEVAVLSFAATQEQLFMHLSPSVTSHGFFDPTAGVATGQTTFDVSGGTGQFAGATGTIVKTWKFIALPPPPPAKAPSEALPARSMAR
jgi:hypothetical protein